MSTRAIALDQREWIGLADIDGPTGQFARILDIYTVIMEGQEPTREAPQHKGVGLTTGTLAPCADATPSR